MSVSYFLRGLDLKSQRTFLPKLTTLYANQKQTSLTATHLKGETPMLPGCIK